MKKKISLHGKERTQEKKNILHFLCRYEKALLTRKALVVSQNKGVNLTSA